MKMSVLDYEILGELTLEKAMITFLINGQCSSVSNEDLVNVEKGIFKLNNIGIIDRRVSERRFKVIDVASSEKRNKKRRVFERLLSS